MSSQAGERLSYPQLLRTPTWSSWRPVVGIVIALAWFFLAGTLLLGFLYVFLVVQTHIQGGSRPTLVDAASLKVVTPASLLWLNLVLATLTPLAFALVRFLHHVRPRWLTSVLPGMRWRFFLACLPISLVAMVLQVVLASLLPTGDTGAAGADPGGSVARLGGQALAFSLVILLTTPLQALGEEYLFRGYVMQAVGSFFGRWDRAALAITIAVSALLFALAHGSQNFPLFFDRFGFGVLAAVLVLTVGGLEAGFALHVMNNFFAFGFAVLYGSITTVLTVSETSWWNVPVTIVQSLVYLGLVLLVARRMGLRSTAPAYQDRAPEAAIGSIGDAPR